MFSDFVYHGLIMTVWMLNFERSALFFNHLNVYVGHWFSNCILYFKWWW